MFRLPWSSSEGSEGSSWIGYALTTCGGGLLVKLFDGVRANTGSLWKRVETLEAKVEKLEGCVTALLNQNTELKVEVNGLRGELGLPPRYFAHVLKTAPAAGAA